MNKTKLEYVLSMMESQPDFTYYRITDSNDSMVYDQQNESFDSARAIAELKRFFDHNEGMFTLNLRNKRTKIGNGYKELGAYTIINIPEVTNRGMNGLGNTESSGFGDMSSSSQFGNSTDIQRLIEQMQKKDERIQELIHSNFLSLMDERNKQFELRMDMLKKETANPNEAFNQAALTTIAGMFGGGGGMNVGINGIGVAEETPTSTDMKERLNKAITRLLKADPNFVNNVEKLANLAEKNPSMYKMAVQQLASL